MFRDIKECDRAIIVYTGFNSRKEICIVHKVTDKFFDVLGERYRKSDGKPISKYSNSYVEPYTLEKEEEIDRIAEERMTLDLIKHFKDWNKVSPEDLKKVCSIINKYK